MTKIRILPVPLGGGVSPTGTLEIRSEGVFDVTDYAEVDVDIFDDTTTKTITNNGVYNAEDDNVLGYSQVTVNVPASAVDTGTKTTSITNNGTSTVDVIGYANNEITVNVPASAVDTGTKQTSITNNGTTTVDVIGYANNEITVNVPASAVDTGTKSITSNGTGIDVVGYAAVDVSVIPNLQSKTATPTTSQQTITADTPTYDGLSSVVVDAVTSAIDPNILARNIKAGVTILGVTGSYTGGAQINPQDFLHFTAVNGTNIINLSNYGNSPEIYYSKNYSEPLENWTNWKNNNYQNFTLNQGETVYFYGENPFGFSTGDNNYSYFQFGNSNRVEIGGKIISLISSYDGIGIPSWSFNKLFRYSSQYIDFSSLDLGGNLGPFCYYQMFLYSRITTTPALPANNLNLGCFQGMFYGCQNLTTMPALPATTLADACYSQMFAECTALTTAPALPATTLANDCYFGMFSGCRALTTAPALPATTLADRCYSQMFGGCTSLTTAPALPATTLANECYSDMFYNCTSLTQAPVLHTTTLSNGCYQNMFNSCTSLTTAPTLPATTMVYNCYSGMFYNCTSLTQAPALPATTLAQYCYNSMFFNCTSLTTAPALPATTLSNGCYYYMFYGCSSLNTITTYATSWYQPSASDWVSGVAATGDFYNLGQATNIPSGTNGIPSGWTEHTSLPVQYFYIKNEYNGSNNFTLTTTGTPNTTDLEYSKDKTTWTAFDLTQSTNTVALNSGEKLYMRSTTGFSKDSFNKLGMNCSQNFSIGGHIATLIDYQNVATINSIPNYCFVLCFSGSNKLIKAEDLDTVGITTVGEGSFVEAFKSCTNLQTAPDFSSVTTVMERGFSKTFYDCHLQTAPDFSSVTTVGENGFYYSFSGSTLTTAPDFSSVTTVGKNGFESAFNYCQYLTTGPDFSSVTTAENGSFGTAFMDCPRLTTVTAPNLSSWNTAYFGNWLSTVAQNGTLYKPSGLTVPDSTSGCPTTAYGWTTVDY